MAATRQGLSLIQKGLLLLAIPLAAQIFLVGNLGSLIRKQTNPSLAPEERQQLKLKRQQEISLIAVAVVLNLSSILLGAFFLLEIARRLTVLNDQMSRFRDGQNVNRIV